MTSPPRAGETTAPMTASEKSEAKRVPEFFGEPGILQDERALHVHATVQATGELKMAVPDSSSGFKDAQQFFS